MFVKENPDRKKKLKLTLQPPNESTENTKNSVDDYSNKELLEKV